MTALQKPDGGVRGIVVGDVFRRLVGRTLAKQFAEQAQGATRPFQYALSTRAGTECVAHVVQALTSLDPSATILSIDGVGAYDSISRRAMFRGLMDMVDGEKLVPFVRLFYDSTSTYIWEDEVGDVRHVLQGEGGEQGDPLMPLLFSLGQHRAMVAVQASLLKGERLFAFFGRHLHRLCAVQGRGGVLVATEAFVGADRRTGAPGQDEDQERRRFEAPSCRRFDSKSSSEPPRSRGVERRSHVGRLKTRFERPWCSSWPPAVRIRKGP